MVAATSCWDLPFLLQVAHLLVLILLEVPRANTMEHTVVVIVVVAKEHVILHQMDHVTLFCQDNYLMPISFHMKVYIVCFSLLLVTSSYKLAIHLQSF